MFVGEHGNRFGVKEISLGYLGYFKLSNVLFSVSQNFSISPSLSV